ncbi:MAG: DUF1566 domain-containing protein, partial [Candidatus Electrothrix sp. AS4_5]|nr:DUF1566 domain-containing protein [Candidatus Electrothrix gigas]
YSGTLLRADSGTRLPTGMKWNEWLRRMQERRSRTALTSGGEEPVADGGGSGHSVFAKAFLDVLRKNKNILDGDSFFDRIKRPVILNAQQTPEYGDIRMTGHEMGDFLLVPKELQKVKLQKQIGKVDLSHLRGGQGSKTVGQDIDHSKTIGQYIDHGNGTVTDTKTGLMWKRCSEGLSGDNCEHGKLEEYTYNDAVKRFKDVKYAGYADWRLPTIDELKTLIYCSKGVNKYGQCNDRSEKPNINQQAFPNTRAWGYWSGSSSASNSASAWFVAFNNVKSNIGYRSDYLPVRLVRSGTSQSSVVEAAAGTLLDQAIDKMSEGESHQNVALQESKKTIGQYITHGNGTVTDTKTGLMWKRCSEGLSGDNCEHGKAEEYTYDDAVKRFKHVSYAGYSDWRVPTINELKTLVYCSKGVQENKRGRCNRGSEEPSINQQAFPNTEKGAYWSGLSSSPFGAWYVYFNLGHSSPGNRKNNLSVRLVRSETSRSDVVGSQDIGRMTEGESHQNAASQEEKKIGQYIDHGNGTVTDTKTGLMWKRCTEGLSGDNCEHGKAEEYTYDDAIKRFKHVSYAGYSDWRLPIIDELKTLVDCSKGVMKDSGRCNKGSKRPTINQQLFPNTEKRAYWSGSSLADRADFAWSVNFSYGYSYTYPHSSSVAVRLLRGGQ